MGFLQLFGGALQAQPRYHLLLPEGLWQRDAIFVALPPPEDADVTAVLHRVLRRLRSRLAALEEARPDDDAASQQAATQRSLLDVPARRPGGRRLAVAHGFSLR